MPDFEHDLEPEARKSGWVLPETVSWQQAVDDFLRQIVGTKEPKTRSYYRLNLARLAVWAQAAALPLADFRVRHMREYLAQRAETKTARGGTVGDRSRRHDAICARVFFRFCAAEGYVSRNPLADYQIPKAPKAYVKCPTADEVKALLSCVQSRWSPATNPKIRYIPQRSRSFIARRDYAILCGLADTAARIGEMLALRLEDYDKERMQITFRTTKTDRPRTVPISAGFRDAVEAFLRLRPKCDSPLLFISRTGTRIEVTAFGVQFRRYADYAGLSGWSLHGLRHYALTSLAEHDVLSAQYIAGHSSLIVTQGYTHVRADRARAVHTEAAPLMALLVNKRTEQAKRKRLI